MQSQKQQQLLALTMATILHQFVSLYKKDLCCPSCSPQQYWNIYLLGWTYCCLFQGFLLLLSRRRWKSLREEAGQSEEKKNHFWNCELCLGQERKVLQKMMIHWQAYKMHIKKTDTLSASTSFRKKKNLCCLRYLFIFISLQ